MKYIYCMNKIEIMSLPIICSRHFDLSKNNLLSKYNLIFIFLDFINDQNKITDCLGLVKIYGLLLFLNFLKSHNF